MRNNSIHSFINAPSQVHSTNSCYYWFATFNEYRLSKNSRTSCTCCPQNLVVNQVASQLMFWIVIYYNTHATAWLYMHESTCLFIIFKCIDKCNQRRILMRLTLKWNFFSTSKTACLSDQHSSDDLWSYIENKSQTKPWNLVWVASHQFYQLLSKPWKIVPFDWDHFISYNLKYLNV